MPSPQPPAAVPITGPAYQAGRKAAEGMRRRRGNEWAVLLTLSLGFFMTLVDLTIVNIAIPDMRRALHASLAEMGWVINAYIIVLATAMITAGRLGDLRGRRTLFLAGVAVFTLASAASGLSQNATELIAARVIQGFGAALLLPHTMAIIIAIFPGNRRGAALGVWGSVAGLATIAGPTVGGALVTWLGWRWIFFLNVPVGVITMVLASLIIPQVRSGRRQPMDLPGVLIATAALVAITYGLVEGQSCHWGPVWSFISIPLILAVGVLLMVTADPRLARPVRESSPPQSQPRPPLRREPWPEPNPRPAAPVRPTAKPWLRPSPEAVLAGAGPSAPLAGPDRWHPWLLRVRHGADEAPRERRLTTFLYPLRNDLLDRAQLRPGETVLDVGTGDGLIAFGALDRAGPTGRVIFSDIAQDLLDRCREAVAAEGLLGRCDFRQAAADSLTSVEDVSVDVVTTRSVLIYVKDRAAALREFHRVLRPGRPGRPG